MPIAVLLGFAAAVRRDRGLPGSAGRRARPRTALQSSALRATPVPAEESPCLRSPHPLRAARARRLRRRRVRRRRRPASRATPVSAHAKAGPRPRDRHRHARRHDAAPALRQDVRHREAQAERQHRHPADARRRDRRPVLLDLGAERRSPVRRRSKTRDGPDRRGARGACGRIRTIWCWRRRPPTSARGRARAQDRRADGHRGRPHDRRRPARAARLRRRSASAT